MTQGWNVCLKGDYYLASKEIEIDKIDSWPPLGVSPSESGILILVGNQTVEQMLDILNSDCASFLARTRYFVPNDEFFGQLESNNVSALYQVDDNLGNTGIVLIGKPTINMNFSQKIEIVNIYEGDSAYNIFD